jgi:hypothetical protein
MTSLLVLGSSFVGILAQGPMVAGRPVDEACRYTLYVVVRWFIRYQSFCLTSHAIT